MLIVTITHEAGKKVGVRERKELQCEDRWFAVLQGSLMESRNRVSDFFCVPCVDGQIHYYAWDKIVEVTIKSTAPNEG